MQFLDTVKKKIGWLTNVNVNNNNNSNNNNNKTTVTCTQVKHADMFFLSIDFPSKIDDRSVGSIRLFPTIDYKISANSHH